MLEWLENLVLSSNHRPLVRRRLILPWAFFFETQMNQYSGACGYVHFGISILQRVLLDINVVSFYCNALYLQISPLEVRRASQTKIKCDISKLVKRQELCNGQNVPQSPL